MIITVLFIIKSIDGLFINYIQKSHLAVIKPEFSDHSDKKNKSHPNIHKRNRKYIIPFSIIHSLVNIHTETQ